MSRSQLPHAFLFAIGVFSAGCTKDEGPLYIPEPVTLDPGIPMDTVFFATEVMPVFQQHCWVCHPPMGEMDLSTGVAYANLVNVPALGYAPALRIVPGDPMASVLWHKISQSTTYGLNMPPNGTFLTNEELQTIRDWIEQGAMDN
ncbi:MAG: hypothetical protein IPL77_06365 [Flavobacteriales bacterium]|nr:hypothetical protein [Flavobacteriales bacterium]